MRHLTFFVIFYLILFISPIEGQIKVSKARLYSVTEGLSQSKVNAIFQDSRGLLWIGTDDGLNRYDGYEFYTYSNQPYDTSSLSNNHINAIAEDNRGLLWIATNKGLNSLNLNTGEIETFYNDPRKSNTLSDNIVLNVYQDKDKILWVKTMKSLDKFDYQSKTFQRFNHYYYVFNNMLENIRFPLLEDKNGNFWVGSKDGLNIFDRDLHLFNRLLNLDYDETSISNDQIYSMCVDKSGGVWIGTASGLNRYIPDSKKFERFYPDIKNKNSGLNTITALNAEPDGTIWVGTLNGILVFNIKTKQFEKPEIFIDNDLAVNMIMRDKSGILWIGTNKGLVKLNTRKPKFNSITPLTRELDMAGYDIGCIYAVDDKTLLIGLRGDGLNIINLETKTVKKYLLVTNKGDNRQNIIYSITRVGDNEYYIGTEGGIVIFNSLTGKSKSFSQATIVNGSNIEIPNRINTLTCDKFGNLWFGTNYGLYFYDLKEFKIISYINNSDDNKSIADNKINQLFLDNLKRLWIATDNGLDLFDDKTGFFNHFDKDAKGEKLFFSNTINCISTDRQGDLWIGTTSGLFNLSLADTTTRVFTEREGLSDNTILAIEVDQNQHIWVSTNRGLNEIDSHLGTIKTYDVYDGLQDYEFNLNSSAKNNINEIFFGGKSGISYFNANLLTKNDFKPAIIVTSIEVISKKGKNISRSFPDDKISIPFGTNVFSVNFAALDYTLPEKNNYAYKLYRDKESEWITIGERHSATFSNLKPGEYIFKVKGTNYDQVWNDETTEMKIYVEAPFWLKPQAYYLYGFIFIILLLAFYRYRTYNLRLSNKILKEREIISLEIDRQREQLALKNQNITDSINYAKRIQEALMPSEKTFRRILPDSFIFHQPKDIVSGDFFWISEKGDKIFVAAVDCTGHGVPGAFMSLIGFELFRKITHSQGIENPAQILTILNREFEEIFNDVEDYVMRDGMDIAFCVIDKKSMVLEYSGAVNPIYLIRDNKITEIAGSRFSVGLDDTPIDNQQIFENKQIVLLEDDVLYLFSDGYADQFGGPEGKKFKYRRFRHLLLTLHQYPMNEQHNLLQERINRWKGEYEQVDDILVIGFKPVFNKPSNHN